MSRVRLSAVYIVKNGAETLRRSLESTAFCDEVIVLDSGSSDASREIAAAAGAKVHERAFDDFASQKNHAVGLAVGDWILSVDADEVVTPELAVEIRRAAAGTDRVEPDAVPAAGASITAYQVKRHTYFLGSLLRFGGHQSDRPVRLFRKIAGRFEGRVHEEVRVTGRVGRLTAPLLHHSTRTVKEYCAKLNHYTDLEAERMGESAAAPKASAILLKPWARFAQKYLLQLGFADGWPGFVYAGLSGYYELVRQAKFWQKSKNYSANI